MKIAASVLAAAVTTVSSAEFIEFCYSQIQTSNSGVELDVYTIWARFSGATDTVLNAFNFNRVDGSVANMFYHKDEATFSESAGSSLLTKSVGTWNPGQTGSATANNPFDSYLTIGGLASAANSTNADPSWPVNGGSWNRPDIPNGFNVGWFNSNPLNLQGRVGVGANLGDAVRLGQFVVDRGANGGLWSLKIGYNSGVVGAPVQFAEGTISLVNCVPAPGAITLLSLVGFAGARRR
jgi:hypothetical protein